MNAKKVVKYWLEGAERSFDTAQYLFKGKRYSDALFFCHLALEKILKGLVVQKTKKQAPYIHDLTRLAQDAGLGLDVKQQFHLKEISTFNLKARYSPVKYDFYKKVSREYAQRYLKITKEFYLWLKKNCPQK